jgi:hypothetical protein
MKQTDSIKIICSPSVKNILFEALKNYNSTAPHANNGFQKGKDSALLNFNTNSNELDFIDSSFQGYCCKAINFHYDHIQSKLNVTLEEQRKLMINMLNGVPTHDQQLDSALQKDKVI